MLYKGDHMKRTRTFICDFCEQKIKETEDVKTITVISGKKRVCPFCFNFLQPRFYFLHLIFILNYNHLNHKVLYNPSKASLKFIGQGLTHNRIYYIQH